MKRILTARTLANLALLAAALHAPGAGAAQQQLRDPFERPAAPARSALATDGAALAPSAADAPAWKPELRAVMFDHARSLVNVSGTVLAVGESVRGYRLVKVGERSVVLAKGGASITLTLDNRELSQ